MERAEDRGRIGARLVVVGALVGAAAGMMMAAVVMLYGWISGAHTVWDAPMGIWAWVFGLEHFGAPENHIWPILLGIGAHMVNSMMLGVVFALVLAAFRPRDVIGSTAIGIAWGVLVWAVMRYLILPLNAGEAALFTDDLIAPEWVWWVAHVAYGMTAGILGFLAGRRAWAGERPRSAELRRAA